MDTLVDSVPKVALIVDAVKKELDAAGMTPRNLTGCVVRNASSAAAVENLINSPIMCWNLVRHPLICTCAPDEICDSASQLPNWMKVCYGDLWFWLRKPREERLSIVQSAADCDKGRSTCDVGDSWGRGCFVNGLPKFGTR